MDNGPIPMTSYYQQNNSIIIKNVSLFRYVAICHPFVHRNISHSYSVRRRVIFYTLPVIMISIVINLPKFLETKAVATKSTQPHLVNVSLLHDFFVYHIKQPAKVKLMPCINN